MALLMAMLMWKGGNPNVLDSYTENYDVNNECWKKKITFYQGWALLLVVQ